LKKYDLAIIIGRFQPFHNGHFAIVDHAKELADRILIIVGSANKPRDTENPFTVEERCKLIEKFDVIALPQVDYKYNDTKWEIDVKDKVDSVIDKCGIICPKICLIGYEKDKTSFYLRKFPEWHLVDSDPFFDKDGTNGVINATDIRKAYFENNMEFVSDRVPEITFQFLQDFSFLECKKLIKEHEMIVKYKEPYKKLRYEVQFNTVDAVVLCQGHLLMVKRKSLPGSGLWAFPGGFLEPDERIKEGIIRELQEETSIEVSEPVLRSCLKHIDFFDHPKRSLRGRTITHAGLFILELNHLPKTKKQLSEVISVDWIPIHKFYQMRDEIFEDHFDIGYSMINGSR
jgi:bifunctional NMN adenylyltransferase/nudix hydrolase